MIYGLSTGIIHGAFGMTPFWASFHAGLVQLHNALYGAVGVFGALIVGLPSGTYWVWWLMVLALALGGLVVGHRRDRILLVAVIVCALLFPVLFYAWVFRHSGFGLQARYVMPVLALIPLLGGELLFRSRSRLPAAVRRYFPGLVIAIVAGFQLFAWWINARDWAGEPNAIWFPSNPQWVPPLGWLVWTAAAIVGAALLLALAISDAARVRVARA